MALINCPECGKEISDKAASCPGCGFPTKNISPKLQTASKTNSWYKTRFSFGVTSLIIGILFFIMVITSAGGIRENSRIMGTSWFFTVSGLLGIFGKRKKWATITSIAIYSFGIVYNLTMAFQVIAHLFLAALMIVFLVLICVSLCEKNSFQQNFY